MGDFYKEEWQLVSTNVRGSQLGGFRKEEGGCSGCDTEEQQYFSPPSVSVTSVVWQGNSCLLKTGVRIRVNRLHLEIIRKTHIEVVEDKEPSLVSSREHGERASRHREDSG